MIAGVASGICLKVVLCGMGSEKVWFLGSAAVTTKYPLREHVLNTKKTDHTICFTQYNRLTKLPYSAGSIKTLENTSLVRDSQ